MSLQKYKTFATISAICSKELRHKENNENEINTAELESTATERSNP